MPLMSKGFSLVELVIGMVLLGIACAGGVMILMSQTAAFSDPLSHQASLQIGNRIIREIQVRAFDEKSDPYGGILRCGETVNEVYGGACSDNLGFDSGESSPEAFDDVDDFITSRLCLTRTDCDSDNFIPASFFYDLTVENEDWKETLKEYSVKIDVRRCSPAVSAQGILSCSSTGTDEAKLIDVAVKQDDGNVIHYSFIKANI